jgi:hypothetical protein
MNDTFLSLLTGLISGAITAVVTYYATFSKARLELTIEYDKELRKAVDLPMRYLFCGSSRVLEKPNATLRMKLDFYEKLQQQGRNLHARGWPLEKIRDKLLGQEGGMTWISQGEFSKLNLIKGLLQ